MVNTLHMTKAQCPSALQEEENAYLCSSRLALAYGGVAHFFLTGLGGGVGVQAGLLPVGYPELSLSCLERQ